MGIFEVCLVLLACVIIAAVLDGCIHRVSLPLIQIAVGFVAALIIPAVSQVEMDSELFLVLFIAPLLFNEAREASRQELWDNKWAILSLAIGLVVLTVLVVGFALHWLVPSIPLAAAFACAAALGPTDAAAVGALGSTVNLSDRQRTLLSGESLINDASGVVSFNFAIAAAVTGSFSLAEAGAEFAVLFFGGIAFGVIAGFIATWLMAIVRLRGFDDTTVSVLYEVFTPFVVFLTAEAIGVSGILAVVAAGLVMARHRPRLSSTTEAQHRMVSDSFWEVIVYLINGVVFVLLGMQLIEAFSPSVSGGSLLAVLGIIVAVTALVILVRFAWVGALDLAGTDPHTGERGYKHVAHTLKDSLVTTVAGPKGAVTLSIIFTIPYTVADGSPFPERDLIVFLTAGVILLTLIIADIALPLLAPVEDDGSEEEKLNLATIAVLEGTIKELEARIKDGTKPEYEPATRLTIASYRMRLAQARRSVESCNDVTSQLMSEVAEVEQNRANEIQDKGMGTHSASDVAPYFATLRGIRSSIGYSGEMTKVGSRRFGWRGALAMLRWRIPFLRPKKIEASRDQVYYDTCLFARELEQAAIDYLDEVAANDPDQRRVQAAKTMRGEHESAVRSLDQRLQYGHGASEGDKDFAEEAQKHFGEQFRKAREYSDSVNAGALSIELEEIRHLEEKGKIGEGVASQLRGNVYLLQMGMSA